MGKRNRERVARVKAGLESPFRSSFKSSMPETKMPSSVVLPGQKTFEKIRKGL